MENREISLRKNQRSAEVYADTHAEYVLPDYLGEIRKILATGAEIKPAAKYSSDGVTETSGIVVYDVLYTDAEGNLSAATFTSDYDLALPRSLEGGDSLHLDSRIASFAVRPAGPRKLSAKATVAAQETVSHTENASPEGSAFAGEREPELSGKEIRLISASESESAERELAECIIRLDGQIADEVSVISSRAEAECESVSISGGEATVKGSITVYAIIKSESDVPYSVTHRIPFTETVEYQDAVGEPFPLATVSSLTTTVSADEEGCEVVASVIADISVRCLGNESVTVITDAYLCECDTENTYGKLSYAELIHASRERINHTAKLSRTDDCIAGLDELLLLTGTARVSCTASGDELSISGTVKYTGAATSLSDLGERSYMPLKFEVPVEESIALPMPVSDTAKIDVRVNVARPSVSLDSEYAYVSATLDTALVITEDKSVNVLESAMAGEERYQKSAATVTVYYPDSSDTLFSVAKAHHVRLAKLARDNALTEAVMAGGGEGALTGVKRLIIY